MRMEKWNRLFLLQIQCGLEVCMKNAFKVIKHAKSTHEWECQDNFVAKMHYDVDEALKAPVTFPPPSFQNF